MNEFVAERFYWRSVWNLLRLDKQVVWIDFNLQGYSISVKQDNDVNIACQLLWCISSNHHQMEL